MPNPSHREVLISFSIFLLSIKREEMLLLITPLQSFHVVFLKMAVLNPKLCILNVHILRANLSLDKLTDQGYFDSLPLTLTGE